MSFSILLHPPPHSLQFAKCTEEEALFCESFSMALYISIFLRFSQRTAEVHYGFEFRIVQFRAIFSSSVFDETRCNLFFPTDDDDDDEQDIEDEDEDMEEEEFGDGPEYPAEASVVPKKMLRQVSYAGQVDVVDVAATTTFAFGDCPSCARRRQNRISSSPLPLRT